MSHKIAVLGAGSWGTALAINLSSKGCKVSMWDIDTEHIISMREHKENKKYLPDIKFNENIKLLENIADAIDGSEIVMFSAPAQHFRSALDTAIPYLTEEMVLVNVAKGIEQKSLMRLSEIAFEKLPNVKYVALSGPSHAEEVGRALPTTVVAASNDLKLAEYVQDVFMTDTFRIYTNSDLIGVELGGALKNIIALGAGISDGMGFGDNTKAAMMTRGITEIARLGVKMGGRPETFFGLSGIGDLIVTCTSMHSRNRRCGIMIGEGVKPFEAIKKVGMVVEGMYTTEAAYKLAKKYDVEMPITEQIYKVINEEIDVKDTVKALMTRRKKHETEDAFCINGGN